MPSDHESSQASVHDEVASDQVDGDGGGLFGEGSDDEALGTRDVISTSQKLKSDELGSEDEEDKVDLDNDDMDGSGNEETHERAQTILDVNIGRHAIPKPSDGELHLLQLPNFIGIEPKAFHNSNFQPPVTEHHSSQPSSSTFSSHQTSNNTIRWRHSPSDPTEIQSNARILRWSDGSLTLQLASNPREQFELTAKPLAPPHGASSKSTTNGANRGRETHGTAAYDSRLDSHTYLAAPHEHASLVRITNHVTSSLAVKSSTDQNDDALVKLQQSLAAATKGNKTAADGGLEIISILEDPERAKKKAELAEKEKVKAQRRRQLQEERERERANRVLGRSGLRTGGYGGGLSVGALEDDDGIGTSKARMVKPKRKSRRRNSDYSDEEEDYRGMGRSREDEYDEDDGFLVGSEEEPELVADDSEEEAEMDDDLNDEEEKPKKSGSKREVTVEAGEGAVGGGRVKRRRVIDDEDED